ncbi:MAG TPA: kelch repeat-containing protein [Acidimicrobiales bacterium]|nr:kelch repeat-containing protein [Acidimicrobiales bacterium]
MALGFWSSSLLLGSLALTTSPANAVPPDTGTWSTTGAPNMGRYGHTATRLASGMVLIAGGTTSTGSTDSFEIYDPTSRSWTISGSMQAPRKGHSATLLRDGRVLVVGGSASPGNLAELYDPQRNSWALTGPMAVIRAEHTATLLPNGKVLVAGGDVGFTPTASAELYDPLTGSWAATGMMVTPRVQHTAVLMDADPCGALCGKVLVTGGEAEKSVTSSATYDLSLTEIYDTTTGMWSSTGAMATGRSDHTATLLLNGKVLVAGGTAGDSRAAIDTPTAEIYDPVLRTWSNTGSLASPRSSHSASPISGGRVLVAGGRNNNSESSFELQSVEIFDSATNSWAAAASLSVPRRIHSATALGSGAVLVSGGVGAAGGSSELYVEQHRRCSRVPVKCA